MYHKLCFSLTQQYIKRDPVIYKPINKREMRGHYRPVAPLILRTRGAVYQPVNSLPSGWPSNPPCPLYGISHWTTFPPFPALPSAPPPQPMCSISSVPILLSSAHSPSFDHVTLLWEQWFPSCPISTPTPPPPPPPRHIIAQCTPNAPGICGVVYVSDFWYSSADSLITRMLMKRWVFSTPHFDTSTTSPS